MIPMQWWGEPGFVLLVVCGGLLGFVAAIALARQVWDSGERRPKHRGDELGPAAKERLVREVQREMRYRELEAEVERLRAQEAKR